MLKTLYELRFEGIDYYAIKFTGTGLMGKDYSLVVKEIWGRLIKQTDTILYTSTNSMLEKLSSDTLSFE